MKKNKNSDSFNVNDLICNLSGRWMKLITAMILGSMIGLIFSQFKQPLYESSAVFSVTINYTQTGSLSDIQEDQAMRGVGSIIFSDNVINQTINDLEMNSLQIPRDQFLKKAFLDRNEFRWTIRYRDKDQQTARQVSKLWAENAGEVLKEGLEHALILDSYYSVLDGFTNCLQRMTLDVDSQEFCGFSDLPELMKAIQSISQQIQIEKELSNGLFSALSIELVQEANLPFTPVRFNRNTLVLSGAIIGLILGCCLFSIRYFISGDGIH